MTLHCSLDWDALFCRSNLEPRFFTIMHNVCSCSARAIVPMLYNVHRTTTPRTYKHNVQLKTSTVQRTIM